MSKENNETTEEETTETTGTHPETNTSDGGALGATERYKSTYRATNNHRAAVRAYCGNNVWAIQNAKATGNW